MSPARLSPERRAEIEQVFEHALDLDGERRNAWLRDRCTNDADLRAVVDGLLAAHESSGILDQPPPNAIESLVPDPLRDRRIGPYRVVRELGRGGMGVVYLAERVDGEFHRRVAIKLLRNSPDADELHRRFIAERQILASLSHPNIALLLDGGTTEGQLPYLVMEYVDGLPITTYCDRHSLDLSARLRLFVDVCRAVNSAHQNLIIHRDIKPGNILVTASGQVKLLDFGIAKLLNSAIGGVDAPYTHTAFRVMTPDYASPEQVRGEPLTTGSDVYALGVVLYELLVGRRPYQIRTGSARELHELVCEREPDRPSAWAKRSPPADESQALSPAMVASVRGMSPDRLERLLVGDLDAIAMMALRKEPRRRYGSAELLAEDIERYLQGLPVHARHPSRAYYVGKFIRRHRMATTLGTVAVLSLIASTAFAVRQSAAHPSPPPPATAALAQARQALSESDETTNFLAGLFDADVPAPGNAAPGSTDELIARGVSQIEQLASQPLVQARMLEGLGLIYQNSGRNVEAKRAYERSLALRDANGGGSRVETATTLLHVANMHRLFGHYTEADSAARRSLRILEATNGPTDPSVAPAWQMLSMLAVYRSDLRAAESYARRSADVLIAAYGPNDPRIAYAVDLLGGALRRLGRNDEGERYMREALALYERQRGSDAPGLVVPLYRLADAVTMDRGDYDEAARLLERGIVIATKSLGENNPRTAYVLGMLGALESRRGNFAKGEQLLLQAVRIFDQTIGRRDVAAGDAYADLAKAYSRVGRWTDAESALRIAIASYDTAVGRAHFIYAGAIAGLCEIHTYTGRLDDAESECRTALAIRTRAFGPRSLALPAPLMLLGDVQAHRGNLATADSLYSAALSILEEHGGGQRHIIEQLYPRMAALRELQHRPTEAAEFRRKAGGKPVRPLDF